MNKKQRQNLERSGWKIGDTREFLGLSDEEVRLIEIKRSLMKTVRQKRKINRMSQEKLARLSGSSQSRIAKLEAASGDVSMDLTVRVLISLGASDQEIAGAIVANGKRQQ